MAMKSYSFGSASKHGYYPIRHMQERFRRGLNAASTSLPSFVAGSSVKFIHTKVGRR